MPDESTDSPAASPGLASRLIEVAAVFTRLGFTAFGGPAAHIGMMEEQVVTRRKWLDRQHFLHLVATLNFIPGPNSTELAIHLGLIRAGLRGLVVAGFCFITPAMLIILPLAWAYVRFGNRPDLPAVRGAMVSIAAVVVAIVAVAGWRFAKSSIRDSFTFVLAAGVLAGEWMLRHVGLGVQAELILLAAAAVAGICWYAWPKILDFPSMPLLLAPTGGVRLNLDPSGWPELLRLAGFFLKVGATLFGSGYVLVTYLQSGLVDGPHPILSHQELVDAVSVGQVTPGPLLTTATFIGYLHGHRIFGHCVAGGILGGVVATIAIFLPSFVLVALFGRLLPKIRENRTARAALDGMNAAVTAMVFSTAFRLSFAMQTGGRPDWPRVAIAILSLALLLWGKINSTWLILAAGAIGAGLTFLRA